MERRKKGGGMSLTAATDDVKIKKFGEIERENVEMRV